MSALVVEVADSTLAYDRSAKRRIYARAGVSTYWIVNLVDRQVEVHTGPSGPGRLARLYPPRGLRPGSRHPLDPGWPRGRPRRGPRYLALIDVVNWGPRTSPRLGARRRRKAIATRSAVVARSQIGLRSRATALRQRPQSRIERRRLKATPCTCHGLPNVRTRNAGAMALPDSDRSNHRRPRGAGPRRRTTLKGKTIRKAADARPPARGDAEFDLVRLAKISGL